MKTFLAAVLLCTPMMAQAADPAGTEKKICRTEEVTGSLFSKRVCHTKAEWAAQEAERARAADDMHDRSRGTGGTIPR